MKKQVIKLTESQIRKMVTESVSRVLKESEMDEGFFDNIKSAWQGAKAGYNTQKFTDSDINADYGNAISNYNAMVNGVKTKADAAKTYAKMINIARNYEKQAAALRAKMKDVYSNHGIDKVYNRNNGKFAGGYEYQDNDAINGGTAFGGLNAAATAAANKRTAAATQQSKALSAGQKPLGAMESKQRNVIPITEAQIRQIVAESVMSVLKESEMDEGFWDNVKAGWKGATQGWKTQSALDTNNDRFQSDAERRQNDMFHGGNAVDKLANKMYYKDAKSSGENMYAMAQQYDAKAKEIRAMAKQLAQKWGVTAVSPVGAKGPVRYGYSEKPAAKPAPAAPTNA